MRDDAEVLQSGSVVGEPETSAGDEAQPHREMEERERMRERRAAERRERLIPQETRQLARWTGEAVLITGSGVDQRRLRELAEDEAKQIRLKEEARRGWLAHCREREQRAADTQQRRQEPRQDPPDEEWRVELELKRARTMRLQEAHRQQIQEANERKRREREAMHQPAEGLFFLKNSY
jgi:hypothetical protein